MMAAIALCRSVEVRVIAARDLRSVSYIGRTNNVYITVESPKTSQGKRRSSRTKTKTGAGKGGYWNETFTVRTNQIFPGDDLRIRAWSDHLPADSKIGGTLINLKSIIEAGGSVEQWFVLYEHKMSGKVAGEVRLGIKILKGGVAKKASSAEKGKALFQTATATAVVTTGTVGAVVVPPAQPVIAEAIPIQPAPVYVAPSPQPLVMYTPLPPPTVYTPASYVAQTPVVYDPPLYGGGLYY